MFRLHKRLLIIVFLGLTISCQRNARFSSIMGSIDDNKSVSAPVCSEISRGEYMLEECVPNETQKCLGQKYEDVVCYKMVNRTCSEFDLYASLSSCENQKPRIEMCNEVKKSEQITCWDRSIDQRLFVSEQFQQPVYVRRKVDVLFVNDNSVSMYEDQTKLSQKLNSFLSGLRGVDWQIGITTTDLSDGPYASHGRLLNMSDSTGETDIKFINENTYNKEELFRLTIQRQESVDCFDKRNENCKGLPSGEERPLGAFINAIKLKDTYNKGFFRDGADLAVVILTDEDEFVPENKSEIAFEPDDVLSAVQDAWGGSKKLSVHGIIIEDGDTKCFNEQQNAIEQKFVVSHASIVTDLVNATGGLTGSICDDDYGPKLASIGADIVEKKNMDRVELADYPVAQTVSVSIRNNSTDRKLESSEFIVSRKTVVIHTPIIPGTSIEVTYIPNN